MRIIVTGANGFTGSHVLRLALDQGHEVFGYVRKESDLSRLDGVNAALFKGDINDRQSLYSAFNGMDTVIHTAASVAIGNTDCAEMRRVNVDGTRNVLETALECGVKRIVYCSTIGVFGDSKGEVVNETYQRTQHSFSSCYDETKLLAQHLVDEYQQKGMDTVSVLPSVIMGKGDPHFGPIVKRFIRRKLPFIVGGSRITSIVHVEDVATLLLKAATNGRSGEKYIASAGELTTRQLFAVLAEELGVSPPKELPEMAVRAVVNVLTLARKIYPFNVAINEELVHYLYDRSLRVDGSKARNELDWIPQSPTLTIRQLTT